MKRLLVVVALLLVGCTQDRGAPVASDSPLKYIHDDTHHVGCWNTTYYTLACLPDSQYAR